MSALLLLSALAIGQTQAEKPVTDAEKKEFLKVLSDLPAKGEFFTDKAIPKVVPYLRVLFAFTEKDLEKYDIYPFVALSSGLSENKEVIQYATANFGKIVHPTLKQFWALQLFRQAEKPPEVAVYLRKALESEEQMLALMLGPEFEQFKDDIIRVSEAGKLMKVELVKEHSIGAFPKYRDVDDYSNKDYVFAPGPVIHAVRPVKQRGELVTYDLKSRTATSKAVPQPKGFRPSDEFSDYFGHPVLTVDALGDLFCRWTIKSQFGFGLLRKGTETFQVRRVDFAFQESYSNWTVGPDGKWYLMTGALGKGPTFYEFDKDLREKRLTALSRTYVLDARFIANDVLHVFTSGVVDTEGGLRCADFDVKRGRWLHNRALLKLEDDAYPENGTILQSPDGSLHYVWGIKDERCAAEVKQSKRALSTGVYYQSEAEGKTVKVCDSERHQAVAIGDRIVVCYSPEKTPEKVFFRVIRHSNLGPVFEMAANKGKDYPLWADRMALHAEGDRIWFVNTHSPNTLYELKLADIAPQKAK